MYFHRRGLRDSQQRMVMEVRLHHATILERNLLNHLAQAIHNGALHLAFGSIRIDDLAADISCDPNLVDLQLLVGDQGNLGDLGEIAALTDMERKSECRAFWQLPLAPARLFRCELNDAGCAGAIEAQHPLNTGASLRCSCWCHFRLSWNTLLEQVEAKLNGILARNVRELIKEGLNYPSHAV